MSAGRITGYTEVMRAAPEKRGTVPDYGKFGLLREAEHPLPREEWKAIRVAGQNKAVENAMIVRKVFVFSPVVRPYCGTMRPVRLLIGEVFPLATFRNSSRTVS